VKQAMISARVLVARTIPCKLASKYQKKGIRKEVEWGRLVVTSLQQVTSSGVGVFVMCHTSSMSASYLP
jgi:hypothetical protein